MVKNEKTYQRTADAYWGREHDFVQKATFYEDEKSRRGALKLAAKMAHYKLI